jgi:glutamate racemase
VPFIGIEPAIKPASLQTKTNKIGILATKGTLNSKLFETTSNSLKDNVEIVEQVGEGLVELIENGNLHSEKMTILLTKYLEKLMNQHIDHLVLGCTHYPYLIPQINEITNNKITIIDSGFAVAKQTKRILEKHQLINNSNNSPVNRFYINTNTDVLKQVIENNNSIKIDYLDF